MIKHHQRVVYNFPFDCPQNCLLAAFTPISGVGRSPGVPAKERTCLPYIGEGVVTFLTIASLRYQTSLTGLNAPRHVTHKPRLVFQAPGPIPRAHRPIAIIDQPTGPTQLSELVVQLADLAKLDVSYTELVRASPS
ncbi:hypothetical protein DY000_02006541 [Brassica cretica]|uniref:Uncharacterized protein n=1 Tax=Brassica cretica TaxID=69181 RepID=A0ABQ7C6N0_BRACR|nr:hypothetical protein DY000_02006541 [Brassica cretica]